MKRILLPVDFSAVTKTALEQAVFFARVFRAELVLIHVHPAEPEFIGYEPGPHSVRNQVAKNIRAESRDLAALEARAKAAGVACKALMIQGYPVEKILSEARTLDTDLIVMGSHGHGAVFSLLVGSITEGVMRKSKCPVLVVPSPQSAA